MFLRPIHRAALFAAFAWGANGAVLLGCAPQPARAPAVQAEPLALLPAGVRRLTNSEFVRTTESLLNSPDGETPKWVVPKDIERELPPDVRQEDGYTRNVQQSMSAVLAVRVAEVAHRIATQAVQARREHIYPCLGQPSRASNDCAHSFVRRMAERGYRRAVSDAEVSDLFTLLERADALTDGASATPAAVRQEAGAAAVLSAILQSPHVWYVSEQGTLGADSAATTTLTAEEIASSIAFTLRGTPPDAALVEAGKSGALLDAEVRQQHARRLLSLPDTRQHYRQFVLQWLEVDSLEQTAKAESVFEVYEAFKPLMLAETERFVDEVFVSHGASLRAILTANFTAVDPKMAVFYGLERFGPRVSLAGSERLGVLQHASFLAAHSHADTTSPILRGDFVLRKVLCERLPRPSELDLEIVMPRPSETLTRREQFLRHGADPQCAQCHDRIDGFGFAFENFDAAGRARTHELDKPVRHDGRVQYGEQTLAFASSQQLAQWLAEQPRAHECFARQAFRFVTGHQHVPAAEDAFIALRETLPPPERENLLEHLVAYVQSDLFVQRRSP